MKQCILGIIALVAVACSQNDSGSDPVGPSQKHLISKITFGGTATVFSYSGDKIVRKETSYSNGETDVTEYTYSGELITKVKSYTRFEDLTTDYIDETTFTYDGDIIVSSINVNNGSVYNSTYQYDKEKLVSRTEYKSNGNVNVYYEYTVDSKGNLITENSMSNDGSYEYNFSYDVKSNMYRDMFPDSFKKIMHIGENNIKTGNGISYTYEYDSYGYPTKQTASDGSNSLSYLIEYK